MLNNYRLDRLPYHRQSDTKSSNSDIATLENDDEQNSSDKYNNLCSNDYVIEKTSRHLVRNGEAEYVASWLGSSLKDAML